MEICFNGIFQDFHLNAINVNVWSMRVWPWWPPKTAVRRGSGWLDSHGTQHSDVPMMVAVLVTAAQYYSREWVEQLYQAKPHFYVATSFCLLVGISRIGPQLIIHWWIEITEHIELWFCPNFRKVWSAVNSHLSVRTKPLINGSLVETSRNSTKMCTTKYNFTLCNLYSA